MPKDMYVTIDELRSNLQSLPPENKDQAVSLLNKMGIDLSQSQTELTGTGVAGMILENRFYKVDSHKALFLKLVEVILSKYPENKEKIFEIKGTKKMYFSRFPGDFTHDYEQILGTRIYADTNENAVQLNRRCQRILQKFAMTANNGWINVDAYR